MPNTIPVDRQTIHDLAVLLETIGPSIAYEPARHDADGYASELRGALQHAARATPANGPSLLDAVPMTRTIKLPRRDHKPGCAGNPSNLEADPAAVTAAQDALTERDQ